MEDQVFFSKFKEICNVHGVSDESYIAYLFRSVYPLIDSSNPYHIHKQVFDMLKVLIALKTPYHKAKIGSLIVDDASRKIMISALETKILNLLNQNGENFSYVKDFVSKRIAAKRISDSYIKDFEKEKRCKYLY